MPDLSVFLPAIRTHLWGQFLDTLEQSCEESSYEVVFAGPFDPPQEARRPFVKFVRTYHAPSAAAQLAALECTGELIFHAVDDARLVPSAVDAAIDAYREAQDRKTVINMRYTEAKDYADVGLPPEYWIAHYHEANRLPGIPPDYHLALHFLMDREYFLEMGGFDCSWEWQNYNLHDLMFRIQYDGGRIVDSPFTVSHADYFHLDEQDHGPINAAAAPDYEKFRAKYSDPHALNPRSIRIDPQNWRQQPEYWPRRFPKAFRTYEEMMS